MRATETTESEPLAAQPDPADTGPGEIVAATDFPPGLIAKLAKISHKQSQELVNLRRGFEKAGGPDPDNEHWRALRQLLEKNHQFQQQLRERLREQLGKLAEALEAGQSREALALWDRIQGNIQQCTGKLRTVMQKEANASKGQVLELRKWRSYAATQKKRELIVEMKALPEAGLAPRDLGRQIQLMHDQWKALGRSEQNEKLWREFKKLSDQAHAPCKAYFRERKQLMAQNLKVRGELCERLERKLAEPGDQPIHILKLNQLISECNASWKRHAPVEQSKIKPLQKRYYAALKQLTSLRKDAVAKNAQRKRSLLEQARQLAEQDDKSAAANEAKRLQSEWKKTGPADFREEKRLRESFQEACDGIFRQQRDEREKRRELARPPAERRHDEKLAGLGPRTGFLEKVEASLFSAGNAERFSELHQAIETAQWKQLPTTDESCDKALADRLQALLAVGSLTELGSQAEACERRQRQTLVRFEIDAGLNSPREDQSLRMELQLQQLASGFGKRGPDNKQLAASLRDAEIALACSGPLSPQARKSLDQRLQKLRQRLSSRPPRSQTG